MTKWICKGCRYRRCYVDDPNEGIVPNQCPDKGITNPCWKRDCTTEERPSAVFDAFAGVDNRVCHLEKKVQDLITAGQGQMKRIQELEYRVKSLQNANFQAQLHAHTWRLEEIEKRVRQLDGHTHERFQCDV